MCTVFFRLQSTYSASICFLIFILILWAKQGNCCFYLINRETEKLGDFLATYLISFPGRTGNEDSFTTRTRYCGGEQEAQNSVFTTRILEGNVREMGWAGTKQWPWGPNATWVLQSVWGRHGGERILTMCKAEGEAEWNPASQKTKHILGVSFTA